MRDLNVAHANRIRLCSGKQIKIFNFIKEEKKVRSCSEDSFCQCWEIRKVLRVTKDVGVFRAGDFRGGDSRVIGIAGEHVQISYMLGTCFIIHLMSHCNVKSPLLGISFSVLRKKSPLKVFWEGIPGAILDLSSAN